MKIKISSAILSISPYLSTSWKNISSLQIGEKGTLLIHLNDGTKVEIPDIDPQSVDTIFEAHARYIDSENPLNLKNLLKNPYSFSLPLQLEGGSPLPEMVHNSEHINLPPLPPEILQKIALIVQSLKIEDIHPAEPHCNCLYCQVARSIQNNKPQEEVAVSEEDLKFRDWEVKQTAEKMYDVTNPLDTNELYHVFLGEPLGCTCGKKNCEHIRAVLNS